jgi:hypothetical protein
MEEDCQEGRTDRDRVNEIDRIGKIGGINKVS